MSHVAIKLEVRVSKAPDLVWLVWLGEQVVGRFMIVGDALDYATILECNPRARREAIAA